MRWLLFILAVTTAPGLRGEQVIIYTESSPPYHYLSERNEVTGSVTDRVRDIVLRAGYEPVFRVFPWARAMKNVQRSPNSLIFSVAKTTEREALLIWIAPVSTFNLSLISLQPEHAGKFSQGVSKLAQYSVAAQRDDIAWQWLSNNGMVEGQNLLACADIACSWQYLTSGRVDFIIEDPALIDVMQADFNVERTAISVAGTIPELTVTGYLAANKAMPGEMAARLIRAASDSKFTNRHSAAYAESTLPQPSTATTPVAKP